MKEPLVVAALVLGSLAFALLLVGEATAGWGAQTSGLETIGLFTLCTKDGCVVYSPEGGLTAAKSLVVIAFLVSMAALVCATVYYCKSVKRDNPETWPRLSLASAIFFFISGGLALLGAIAFAADGIQVARSKRGGAWTLSYSFALDIVGAILCVVAGALTMVHRSLST